MRAPVCAHPREIVSFCFVFAFVFVWLMLIHMSNTDLCNQSCLSVRPS